MAKFYYATHAARVPEILRNGIGFPAGEKAIFVLGSAEAATRFGNQLYGAEAETLEIDGSIPTYEIGTSSASGLVALSRHVPATAISRMTPLKSLREESKSAKRRLNVGTYADLSARTYSDFFHRRFMLIHRTDLEGKPFVFMRFEDDANRDLLRVGGDFLFGHGRSWRTAEALADAVITEEIKLHRDFPRVRVFHDDSRVWEIVQEGFNGVDVEIWHVSADALERNWGDLLEEPGWYWQRMDRQGLHGPFDEPEAALRDTEENYETSGIVKPKAAMRP